ncbi:MAG TPA: NAD(P)/FAD-dependent oxidoreductase, partial [Planctomycetota bacterium]|nr:NAD(P)/FAD-dependent oxidoreductase [Planctomycetota bacterium]
MADLKRILVLGGGFAGMYAARRLEKRLGKRRDVEITLVNRDNYFLFTPMLHEIASGELDVTHIVNPVRKLLRRTRFFDGDVHAIDLDRRVVSVSHGREEHPHELPYDHLVLALGSVVNTYGLPGLESRALPMKELGDAIRLRSRLIESLEEADFECCPKVRERNLTLVVAGGGFAGVETVASAHDFLEQARAFHPRLRRAKLRVVLVHSGAEILPELGPALGAYARRKLAERGVEVILGAKVAAQDADGVTLADGRRIPTHNLVWTAGTAPHPLLKTLPCALDRGRIAVDATLAVPGRPGVWALGDCAAVPDPSGGLCPPTAQHASRQGTTVADNVASAVVGRGAPRPFAFKTLGLLASLGRRTGVARIFGLNVSGFPAWWLWRTIYLFKLPRFEKKFRVMLDWTLDLVFAKDLVQFHSVRRSLIAT